MFVVELYMRTGDISVSIRGGVTVVLRHALSTGSVGMSYYIVDFHKFLVLLYCFWGTRH